MLGLWLLASLGCGGEGPPQVIDSRSPIRLIDHLDRAEISSPLLEATSPGELLAELERPTAPARWTGDFSPGGDYRQMGCRSLEGGGIECDRRTGSTFSLRFAVPSAASGHTAIVLDLRAERPECVMVEVWDQAERIRLPLPREATAWRRLPILWPAREGTTELAVRLRPQRLTGPCQVALRSGSAHHLEASPELALALLNARGSRGAAGEPSIAGFGDHLPLADAETVQAPFDDNFSSREVLLAPAPTEARFRLRLPRGARLGFSYALGRESAPGDRVDFEVRARPESGAERVLWADTLAATPQSWHWHEATVLLSELGGQTVELVLATRSAGGAGVAVWGTPTVHVPRRTGRPPNVILIAVDTLRADRLSSYGYAQLTTPRIDAFAEDGVLFRQAVAQSNWTLPSFASIFTGKIVARHRLTNFVQRLAPGAVTLQGLFRENGWRTHAVLYKAALYQRLDRGFETTFNVPRRKYQAQENLDKALGLLDRVRDQRFFLFVHFDDPHQPFTHPAEFRRPETVEGLRTLGLEMPLNLPSDLLRCPSCLADGNASEAVRSLVNRLYDEEVRYVDDRIGELLDALRRLGLYDEALIAFVSDHGETLWSHYDYLLHGGANLHDELIRVPLIVKPPAGEGFRRGAVVDGRVRAFDLMPTLLELAGLGVPPDLDAASLAPLLRQGAQEQGGKHRPAFSQGSSSAALLQGRYKYLMPVGSGVPPAQENRPSLAGEQLYDLEADPAELRDLAAEEPARLGQMRQAAIEYLVGAVGGRFLLVAGEAAGDEVALRVSCEESCSWDPLLQFGLEVSGGAGGVTDFVGPGLGDGVLFLARLGDEPDGRIRVRVGGAEGVEAQAGAVDLEPGVVDRLLRRDGLAAWVVAAPDRAGEALEGSVLDPQQEEALRDLGYLQ